MASTTTDPAEVLSVLKRRGLSLATAESLTAGEISATLANVPGASQVLYGGVVSYQNSVKHRVLGVDQHLLDTVGAVDETVAIQMARGATVTAGAEVGISATGVAGPEPHQGKPVGTVWIGVSGPNGDRAQLFHLAGDRSEIRAQSVNAAFEVLLKEFTQ